MGLPCAYVLQAAQFIALAELLGACCQRHLAFTHPFVQAVGAHAQAAGDIGHAVAVVKDLFDRLCLEFFGITLTAHTGSYWTGNRRLLTVYKTLGDSH